MRFVRLLLIGLVAASAGCAAWPQPAQTNFGPSATPRTHNDPVRSGDAAPFLTSPGAWDWPHVDLGRSVAAPPDRALARTAPATVPAAPVTIGTPAQAARPTPEKLPWLSEFESTQRRPIHTAILGSGAEHVLVTGSLAGNDPAAAQLLDALLGRLSSQPELLDGYQSVLVRTPHPDGLAEHISVNARGVDLNRNFPSHRFTASPSRETGPHPASEAETRVMLRLLGEARPVRVIHVRTGKSARTLVTGNAACLELLGHLRSRFPVDIATFDGEFKIGSLEEFAATRLTAQVLVVELPSGASLPSDAVDLVVAAAFSPRADIARPPHGGPQAPADSNSPIASQSGANPAALTGAVENAGPDGEHGYAELLPPPPHFATDGASRTESRLYELTPP